MYKYGNKSSTSKVSRRLVKRTARRIPMSVRTTGVSMKVEFDDLIFWNNGNSQPTVDSTGNSYLNFSAILLANPAFVSQATNFIRYKITGCTFTATPCYTETSINAAFGVVGIPILCAQQYISLKSQSVGSECCNSDNNLVIKPNDLTQSKYWSYRSNFMIGTGNGVGTWNQTNDVANQQGQFSVVAPNPNGNYVAGALAFLYAIRVCLYVVLDVKTR